VKERHIYLDPQSVSELETHPSLVELLGSLFRQLADLVRDEISLAKSEFHDRLRSYRLAAAITATGLLLGMLASMALVAAGIVALIPYLGGALSALVVGALLGVVSLICVMLGIRQFGRKE
jgi:amino acid transporter